MGVNAIDIDAVTALLHDAAQHVMLPRFRRLDAEHVERKATPGDPYDVVTIVDREVEARLTAALLDLAPQAQVIGEEAAHAQPDLVRLVHTERPLWILDPLDGTKNFARGDDRFGIILAWFVGGAVRAGWIVLPAQGHTFVAEAGGGLVWNGRRATVPSRPIDRLLRGSLHERYMPAPLRDALTDAARGRFKVVEAASCAAVEYAQVIRGQREFSIYYRLRPWDHAAPALILTEAGGAVEHLDGTPYSARSPDQPTVVARDPDVSAAVRSWFVGGLGNLSKGG